jgi:protein phosphatase
MSTGEAQRHPMRHVLTKVVGLREELEATVSSRDFVRGDVLVMCSDGLHGSVSDEEIARATASTEPVAAIAQRLVDQALARGATDNVTVIVVRNE